MVLRCCKTLTFVFCRKQVSYTSFPKPYRRWGCRWPPLRTPWRCWWLQVRPGSPLLLLPSARKTVGGTWNMSFFRHSYKHGDLAWGECWSVSQCFVLCILFIMPYGTLMNRDFTSKLTIISSLHVTYRQCDVISIWPRPETELFKYRIVHFVMFCPDNDCSIAVETCWQFVNYYMHPLHVETGWSLRKMIHHVQIENLYKIFLGNLWKFCEAPCMPVGKG